MRGKRSEFLVFEMQSRRYKNGVGKVQLKSSHKSPCPAVMYITKCYCKRLNANYDICQPNSPLWVKLYGIYVGCVCAAAYIYIFYPHTIYVLAVFQDKT